jgi:hypothetical protein
MHSLEPVKTILPGELVAGRSVNGGLMSAGPSAEDESRQARSTSIGSEGAKPADWPAVQPARYDLTVNVKTAATLGLTIPPPVPLRGTTSSCRDIHRAPLLRRPKRERQPETTRLC